MPKIGREYAKIRDYEFCKRQGFQNTFGRIDRSLMKKDEMIKTHILTNGSTDLKWHFAICPDHTGWFDLYCSDLGISPRSSLEVPVDLFEALTLLELCLLLGAKRVSGKEFKDLNYFNAFKLYVYQ